MGSGRHDKALLDALFPLAKQRVLTLLFGQPERSFTTMELIRLAGVGSGAVQREVQKLVATELVLSVQTDGSKRLSANPSSALFRELCAIIDKTSGVAGQLKKALNPLAPSISLAVLYGSVAKGTDRATSDIDLLIVADDVPLERVYELLETVEQKLARRVSPTMYTAKEFRERRAAQNPFLTKVLSGKHIILLGSEGAIPTR